MATSRGGRTPTAPRYDPNAPANVAEAVRANLMKNRLTTEADQRAAASNATQSVVQATKNTNALPPGAAESGGKGQSLANQAEIARRVMPMTATHMPDRSFTPAAPMYSPLDTSQHLAPGMPETHSHPMPSRSDIAPLPSNSKKGDAVNLARNMALYANHDAPAAAPTPKAGPMYAGAGNNAPFRGSTPEEIAEFRATDPNVAANTATTAAAGTGKSVVTPYGTASSRTAAPAEATVAALNAPASPIKDANGTQTGVGRPGPAKIPWQNQVLAAHPEIGVKDSPQNKAFVAAYKGGKVQPGKELDFSHTLYPNAAQGATAGAQGSLAGVHANPPQAPVTGPGSNVSPGTVIASTPGIVDAAKQGLKAAIGGASSAAGKSVADVASGVSSVLPNQPQTPPPMYTPSSAVGAAAAAPPPMVDIGRAKAYAKAFHDSVGPLFHGGMYSPSDSSASAGGTPPVASPTAGPMYNPVQGPPSPGIDGSMIGKNESWESRDARVSGGTPPPAATPTKVPDTASF